MDNCLFQQDWWLDATAPGKWSAVEIRRGEHVAARMPYVKRIEKGMVHIGQPQLTQTLGPWIRPSDAKQAKALADEKEFMNELIDGLPRFDVFSQRFHSSVTNWLPFHWRGFEQTTRYTYVLDDITDKDVLWSGLMENIRREIKKAQKQVVVSCAPDADKLLRLVGLTYGRQGRSSRITPSLFARIDAACSAKACHRFFFAEDEEGRTHAALYLVWDERSAYYLIGGGDPNLRTSGATSLLMWEAIQFASSVTKRFDFEGSMVEPIERFFRSFGARQSPYFHVTGYSRRGKLLAATRNLVLAMRVKPEK